MLQHNDRTTDDATDAVATLGTQGFPDLDAVAGSTKWSMGGAASPAEGSWMATVYGGGENDYPDAMTGTFNADGTTGRISGAFGVMEE